MNSGEQVFVRTYVILWCFVRAYVLSDVYWRVELLGHMITLCLTFWGSAKLFFKATAPLYMLTSSVWGFLSLHTFSSILVIVCLLLIILAMLVCVKWYFIVVLIYISLMTSNVEHLSICLYVFLENDFSGLLSIF